MNHDIGAVWRRWDLHVHTPASLVHDYSGQDPWPEFIAELEQLPPEFKVIGVNDYIFLDGYRRLLQEKSSGRLGNIELLLPVIELRLDKFGGSQGHLSRVNYHVIFSNDLSPDLIEQHFLNALSRKYTVSPQHDRLRTGGKWAALPTRESLEDLGKLIIESVPEAERGKFYAPLIEGFNNLSLSLDSINDALTSHYFSDRFVTAVGKTEWANVKWNDQSIAEKKNIINAAHLVFISAETIEDWTRAKQSLTAAGVNDHLLDCSDAHAFSNSAQKDRIGKCFTWIKADPTFEGLLQVLNEPDRVFVGDLPPKLVRARANATKYIDSLRIEKKPDASLSETWFDNSFPLNPDLIAIIGNKGKGKSALTDIIGLLCNTRQHKDFTFLSSANFRQPKDNKAKHFRATMTWRSGATTSKGLEEVVDEQKPELVKYIPQNFLEKICTQLGKIEESDFDRELKKVIFSHVDTAHRLGKPSLDELVAYKTSEASEKINILKQELHHINEQVVELEAKSRQDYRKKLDNLLETKREELAAHDKTKPAEIPKPENDPVRQKEISEATLAIEGARKELTECEEQITKLRQQEGILFQQLAVSERVIGRLANLEKQIQTFLTESQKDLEEIGLKADDILKVTITNKPVLTAKESFVAEGVKVRHQLDESKEDSVTKRMFGIQERIEQLQTNLDEPNKKYQAYEAALREWEGRRLAIIGNQNAVGSLKYYEFQIIALGAVAEQLKQARVTRIAKAKEIHGVIKELANTYRELYAPVHEFIESRPLARDKFHLNFEVAIIDTGFENSFFDFINRGVSGTFCGLEDGHKMLSGMLASHEFSTADGVEGFLADVTLALEQDRRPGGKPTVVSDQLKKGKAVLDLYDMVFSLGYLKPRYALRMGEKELHELSPGERGTLLLVFYLLVDKDDIPLVIDQPEENLDNQTVYELLVPCMKEAKSRRQIFIVTHNPNLAVVCDAEQVICAALDKKDKYRMHYIAGAIENPKINRAIVDILEGTMPAFDNRDSKYQETSS